MKLFLATTAVIEMAVGIGLMVMPEVLASILLGASPGTPADVFVAHLAGAALLSLGVACLLGSRDVQSRAAFGVAVAMLIYNLAAVGLLLLARYSSGLTGMGLLPAAVLHAALVVWCVHVSVQVYRTALRRHV